MRHEGKIDSPQPFAELRRVIAAKKVVVVAGSGVSAAAANGSAVTSWSGLLASACEFAAQHCPDRRKAYALKELVWDPGGLVLVGQLVTRLLGGQEGALFKQWLREAIGSLKLLDPSLPRALIALGAPIATTNYDDLIVKAAPGWKSVTWLETRLMLEALRGDLKAVTHLHGRWEDPESVVLGTSSYEHLRANRPAQTLQQAMSLMSTMLFVGVGDGAEDPNIGELVKWLSAEFSDSSYPHYLLCRQSKLEELRAKYTNSKIVPVSYGEVHAQLVSYLGTLGHAVRDGGPSTWPAAIGPVQAPDDRSYRELCRRYVKEVIDDCRYIDLGDLGSEPDSPECPPVRALRLKAVYVSLQADSRSIADRLHEEELKRLDEADRRGEGTRRSQPLAESISQIAARERKHVAASEEDGVPLEKAFDEQRILVVLGHPGSGKSVLCQWLALKLAEQAQRSLQDDSGASLVLPMKFRAVDYAEFNAERIAAGEQPCDLAEFMAMAGHDLADLGTTGALKGMFDRALTSGQAVILVDGLDELTEHRTEVIQALVKAVNAHVVGDRFARNKAVITSRFYGYDDLSFSIADVGRYFIRPMSPDQVEQFVHGFFELLQADTQAELFLERLKDQDDTVRRLAREPLMLASMCSLWHRSGDLPASRSGLYRRLLVDTGLRWRQSPLGAVSDGSELAALLEDEDAFLRILSRVAVRIHKEYPDGRIHTESLLETLDDAVFGLGRFTEASAHRAGAELIERIQQKVGPFAEFAVGEFGFMHQTFREYLVAYDLAHAGRAEDGDAGGTTHVLFVKLREWISDPRWREPLRLVLDGCDSATRTTMIEEARHEGALDLEEWSALFLLAALDRPAAEIEAAELGSLLGLCAQAYVTNRDLPQILPALDAQLVRLREHVGITVFDETALGLLARDEGATGPLAALYWRCRWLSSRTLAVFADAACRDSAEWNWPMMRALRLAEAPPPLRKAHIQKSLNEPADDGDPDSAAAMRLYALAYEQWQHRRALDAHHQDKEKVPAGLLAVREYLSAHRDVWSRCLREERCLQALCALFGGLDHHDTLYWAGENEDFARLLVKSDFARQSEIEARAWELVPRFGVNDVVYDIAVTLGGDGKAVTYELPVPAVDVAWMTRPSTVAVRTAVVGALDRSDGGAKGLCDALEELILTPASSEQDRAEAELGLLMLRGREMRVSEAGRLALERALEACGDAMIRGHSRWLAAIWTDDSSITAAERAAMHRFVLRLSFLFAGRPVQLTHSRELRTRDTETLPPVLLADWIADRIYARSWGDEVPLGMQLHGFSAKQILGAMAWLTTLPYQASLDGLTARAALWHEDMPDAFAMPRAALDRDVSGIIAWAHVVAPDLEPDLSRAVQMAYDSSVGELSPALADLYNHLQTGRRVGDAQLAQIRALSAGAPHTGKTSLAYLLIGLSRNAGESGPVAWQLAALQMLEEETNEGQRAEALVRMRNYLVKEKRVQRRWEELATRIGSPMLRADAADDFAAAGEALVELVGLRVDVATRVSMLVVSRVVHELQRMKGSASRRGPQPQLAGRSGRRAAEGAVGASLAPLDGAAVARIRALLDAEQPDGEAVLQQLSLVSSLEPDAAADLGELVEGAERDTVWVNCARNLLALHRIETDGWREGAFRELVELICDGDAGTATRALLYLLGPLTWSNRDTRHHTLSERGWPLWWELGEEASKAHHPQQRRLYIGALWEWDVDDDAAVRELLAHAERKPHGTLVLRELLCASTIWREQPQLALVEWLAGVEPSPALAEACLGMVSMLATNDSGVEVVEQLSAAVARICASTASETRTIAVTRGGWRQEVATPVAEACLTALGQRPEGASWLEIARSALMERTTPVLTRDGAGKAHVDLEGYGLLFWIGSGARPEYAAKFVPPELAGEPAITLLSQWAIQLDGEGAGELLRAPPLAYATFEAVLSLLVVLSARDGSKFRLWCQPEYMQPVLGRASLSMATAGQAAALTLMGRLRHVDVRPAHDPGIFEVMEVGLGMDPIVRATVFDFLKSVRDLRGAGIAEAILEAMRIAANESIAQGFGALAAAYLESSSCSSAERRMIRQALRSEGDPAAMRRAVHLTGTGATNDPFKAVVGDTRRSVLRSLIAKASVGRAGTHVVEELTAFPAR